MALLERAPTAEDRQAAEGVLNYYLDQYGRWIARQWRPSKKNFTEPKGNGNEKEGR